jgi:hypothetical protein
VEYNNKIEKIARKVRVKARSHVQGVEDSRMETGQWQEREWIKVR